MAAFIQQVGNVLSHLLTFQLKSNPSEKEEREAQNQLRRSDEIQRLLAQAHDSYDSRDCGTAAALLDTVIEVNAASCGSAGAGRASLPAAPQFFSAVHRPAFGTWPLAR